MTLFNITKGNQVDFHLYISLTFVTDICNSARIYIIHSKLIAIRFCTCYEISTVGACAKSYNDMINNIFIESKAVSLENVNCKYGAFDETDPW